jgi:hypothetical protein
MIHEPALRRIEDGVVYDADTIKLVFEQLLENAKVNSPETASFTALFVDADDEFVVGQYVPEIWFVLRKVVEDEDDQAG